tara:strand:- start:34 stop:1680 length:1647 start_codon:yes stop_codon:yes gene_type:complete
MDESRRKELELRLARLQDEKERRVSAPDEPSPVDAALEVEGDEDEWADDFGQGIAASLMKTGYGIADLVGGVGEGTFQLDPERLEDLQTDAKDSWGGTVGNVVGEVGQLAALAAGTIGSFGSATPVTAPAAVASVGRIGMLLKNAASGAKMAGRGLGKINPKTPVLREAALAGELGALQYADEGDSRLGNAAANAAMVGVGGLALGGLGRAVKGVKTSKEAKQAMARGDELTPGQAADNSFLGSLTRGGENLLALVPGTAKGTQIARDRGMRGWSKNAIKSVTDTLGMAAPKNFNTTAAKAMVKKFDENTTAAWNSAIPFSPSDAFDDVIVANWKRIGKKQRKKIDEITERLYDKDGGMRILDGDELRLLYDDLGAMKGKKTPGFNEALDDMRNAIRKNMGDEAGAKVDALRKIYPEYITVKTVLHNAGKVEGGVIISPKMLNTAAKTVGRKGLKGATDEEPFANAVLEGVETVGRIQPNVLYDAIKGFAQLAPSPQKLMDAGGRATLGQTKVQQIAQPAIRRMEALSKALRKKRGTGIGSVFAGMEQ